ncbi:MAG: carboxymuconolactone decarboxylase family protein [Oscillochloris sp.]|nr:carboxymuconolactone decarboxylase family protein [Oscillochloris sp.]
MHKPAAGIFHRRHYQHINQIWSDLRTLLALRGRGEISPAMRERIMLIITGVNQCRYCASYHSQAAQLHGLSVEEVTLLLGGSTEAVPQAELPALIYAQHWAAAAGQPTEDLHAQLIAHYGVAQAQAIERALRMIWMGNLLGNTWDALLFRLSGGQTKAN